MYNFEKLEVWKRSMGLIEIVYKISKKVPKSEKFNLLDQLKRAVISIPLNIAEGSGGQNKKIFKNYLYIARQSLFETITILKIIERIYKIDTSKEITECNEISKMLSGLIKSQL